jgi:hypothetical protein
MPFNFKTDDGFYSTWKEGSAAYIKDELRWKKVTSGYMKVDGAWEPFFIANKGNVKNLQTVTTNNNITFTWDAAEDIKEYEVWVSKQPRAILTANYTKVDHILGTPSVIDNFPSNVVSTTNKIVLQNGSKIVTGISTTFLSTLKVGNILYVTIDSIRTFVGVIASIQSNTSLTLKNAWAGFDINSPGINMIYQTHNTYTYTTDRESQYYFYFVPIDINNIPADQSTVVSRATPDAVPTVPVIVLGSSNPRTGSATITWSPDPRAVRYALYWNSANGTNNLTFKEYFVPSPTAGQYTQTYTTVTNGTYKLAIAAINNIGEESAKSNVIDYTYTPYVSKTLAKPVLNATASSWDRATFTWANITDAGSYEIFIRTNGAGSYVSQGLKTSPYTFVGVRNSTYDVFVRASGVFNPDWVYTNNPVDSNVKRLNTGYPSSTTSTRTNGSQFLDYTGTARDWTRRRVVTVRGVVRSSTVTSGRESVSFSPGAIYPTSRTVQVSGTVATGTRDFYTYSGYSSSYYRDFPNDYNIGTVRQGSDVGSWGGTLTSNTNSTTKIVTARVSGGSRRPTVIASFHYFTTTNVAGVNATIT